MLHARPSWEVTILLKSCRKSVLTETMEGLMFQKDTLGNASDKPQSNRNLPLSSSLLFLPSFFYFLPLPSSRFQRTATLQGRVELPIGFPRSGCWIQTGDRLISCQAPNHCATKALILGTTVQKRTGNEPQRLQHPECKAALGRPGTRHVATWHAGSGSFQPASLSPSLRPSKSELADGAWQNPPALPLSSQFRSPTWGCASDALGPVSASLPVRTALPTSSAAPGRALLRQLRDGRASRYHGNGASCV
ncbi:uncharacterized protein LOC135228635, partial [Loxodonta africana]|uniref:uncharacterized protein LOC135228635 n=1 Tax=Loxodonta africana TaxID=9785 RepID=UPI0030D30025